MATSQPKLELVTPTAPSGPPTVDEPKYDPQHFETYFKAILESKETSMSGPTREEFDAKLETIETKMDARVQAIGSKIDLANAGIASQLQTALARMEGREAASEQRAQRMETDIMDARKDNAENAKAIDQKISGLKTTVIVTALSAAITIVLGVAAFNATVLSNMVASFESGKNTSAAQAEIKRQIEETNAALKKTQELAKNIQDQQSEAEAKASRSTKH